MTQEEIWLNLYEGAIEGAIKGASTKWIRGINSLDLRTLPVIEDLSIPHWKVHPILGKSPEASFWYRLSRGIFNVNQRLRAEDQLAYLEERDLFHDTFGHLPILYDPDYTNYLYGIGNIAMHMTQDPVNQRILSNVYWFTSEFGLVEEDGKIKAYGAGILSSRGELEYALSEKSRKELFDIRKMAAIESYPTDTFQDTYYVLRDWTHLRYVLQWLWDELI